MTKQQLIEENLNLVYHIVHRNYPTFVNDEDIVQTGMLGLCKAADKWDEERGMFSTYATSCINNEIRQEFRRRKKHQGVLSLDYEVDDGSGERVPFGDFCVGEEDVNYVDVDSLYDQLTPFEQDIYKLLQVGMTASEIAKAFNCGKQTVQQKIRKMKLLWGNLDND